MLKQKQFTRPPKKQKPKTANPETPEEFQEAADFHEDAGGKHRVGDSVKSARAFLRALEVYDQGLHKHPKNFDLAYNKARLQLEISQQESLVEHIGHDLHEWLSITLQSHQYALRLDEENPDLLFNTSQVLTGLAEILEEAGVSEKAIALWQQALEMLSSCLSRQEIMFEQHRADFPDTEDGGVALEPGEVPETTADADTDTNMADQVEQSATIETPVSALDLLDTLHASLTVLIALVSVVTEAGLENLQNMSQHLTQVKAPNYIALLPEEDQDKTRITTAGLRATFTAALADAQFQAGLIDIRAYAERLDAFQVPGKELHVTILGPEAEARRELVRSALDLEDEPLQATLCWKQLSLAQDVLSKAAALTDEDAQSRKAEIYLSKGDVELLRHHLIQQRPQAVADPLSDAIRKSAPTLIQNARKFYTGSSQFASREGDEDANLVAVQRLAIAKGIAAYLYNEAWPDADTRRQMAEQSEAAINDYLLSEDLMTAILSDGPPSGGSSS